MDFARSQFSGRLTWDLPMKNTLAKENEDSGSSECILELACFVKTPRLCFDNIKIGCTKTLPLTIFNPGNATEKIVLEKFPLPETKFKIEGLEEDGILSLELEPQQQIILQITWQPTVAGNFRHSMVFKWIGGQKLQVTILASSVDPNAGKKKKVRRKAPAKTLQPSNKTNIIQRKTEFDKLKKDKLNKPGTPENPQLAKIVEILPDTPTRRQTFTVAQPKFDKCSNDNEKENYIDGVENFRRSEGTFHIRSTTRQVEAENTRSSKTASGHENKDPITIQDYREPEDENPEFTKATEIFSETALLDSNTFHESEIRLSSSPIKYFGHNDFLPMMKPKSDLNPGQVVLNGEVKHQFIPYPSFNNTDTFWNIEMSTDAKSKPHDDDSLSFGSAASSLFTITREEKFLPHLETVDETSIGTPRNVTTRTLTNENCNDVELESIGIESENADTLRASGVFGGSVAKSPEMVSVIDNKVNDTEPVFKGFSVESHNEEVFGVQFLPQNEMQILAESSQEMETPAEVARDAVDSGIPLQKDLNVSTKSTRCGLIPEVSVKKETRDPADFSQTSSLSENNTREETRVSMKAECSAIDNDIVHSRHAIPIYTSRLNKGEKLQKSNVKKHDNKVIESRYLKTQNKSLKIGNNRNKEVKESIKKDKNIIDAKFKSVVLPKKRKSDAGNSTKNIVKPSVAIKKLKLVKPVSKMPRHPMPYAARNMFYDERWIEKQERGFKNWLNYVLTPPDDDNESEVEHRKGNIVLESDSSQPVAPTKEVLSFRLYAARRGMAKLRRNACALYQSDKLADVICKIEREIEHGRLAIRADRQVDADLGVRKHIADMLLSFNTLWLRIGLEVVFGEIIPMQSNNDVNSLSRFIQRRLLANPDIAAEYSHPSVPGLYKPGYVETLAKFTLKKLLLVIIFVDCAKNSRLISHDPCLFRREAEFKATRDMLICFSKNYLHREGDVIKHLKYIGYTVSHCQLPLHEFDFGVTNLAVDIRDGLRLVRVVELLTKNWNLSSRLRVPAVSRLQKVHNVGVALQGLKEHGFEQNGQIIDPKYIVDGHREKTLLLLWNIIFHFQVDLLLDENKLADEIKHLEKNKMLKMESNQLRTNPELSMGQKRRSLDTSVYFKSNKLSLLLKWCKLVCALHDIKIENFTVSFSDGRALCCLIHHYHPGLLPKQLINVETSVTCGTSLDPEQDIDDELIYENWTQCFSPTTGVNRKLEKLLQNEKQNFATFSEKVKEIGGGPAMIFASDMSNTIPDEKVVIAFLSFLCSRLLDIREEIRAARCIQTAWRQYHLKKEKQKYKAFTTAVTSLQAYARGYLVRQHIEKMKKACIKIQACWRRYITGKQIRNEEEEMQILLQEVAATKMQAVARGFLHRNKLERQKQAAVVLQRAIRDLLARKKQATANSAAIVIQQRYRTWKLASKTRYEFLAKRNASITIQRLYRKHRELVAKTLSEKAVVIQSIWRMYEQRRRFLLQKRSSIIIQKSFRSYFARTKFLKTKQAAAILQNRLRAYVCGKAVRAEFLEKLNSVIKIQRAYREFAERKRQKRINAALCIQSNLRMMNRRKRYNALRRAVVLIQARFRERIARRKYLKLLKAAMIIQERFRSLKQAREARTSFQTLRNACVMLQARFRSMKCRKRYAILKAYAVKIQAVYRGKKCRDKYLQVKASAVVLQRRFRAVIKGKAVRQRYEETRAACVAIQTRYRCKKQRQQFLEFRLQVCKLQAVYKGKKARRVFLKLKESVVVIQRRYRAVVAGKASREIYLIQREACVAIQAWYRCKKQRQKFVEFRAQVCKLQAVYKGKKARSVFLKLKESVVFIQRRYRAVVAGKASLEIYLRQREACVAIQAWYRCKKQRQKFVEFRAQVCKLQAVYKGKKALRVFLKLKESVVFIQRRYRAFVAGKASLEIYLRQRNACVAIQAWYRCKNQQQRYNAMKQAAVLIQRNFRMYTASRKYQKIKAATLVIQRKYRALRIGQATQVHYLITRAATITIQSAYRGYRERKELKNRHNAARKIQAIVRMRIARQKYVELKSAVSRIQVHYRAAKQGEKLAKDYQEIRRSTIVLQAAYRGYCVRREIEVMTHAATKIQAIVRMRIAREQYLELKSAVRCIQVHYRAVKFGEKLAKDYQELKRSTIVLQAAYRGYCVRKEIAIMNRAATKIQATFRAHTSRCKYLKMIKAIVKIQTCYRRYREETHYSKVQESVLKIQRMYKGYLMTKKAYKQFQIIRKSAVVIQAAFRGYAQKKRFLELRKSVVKFQRFWRVCLENKARDSAAVTLQGRWRAYRLGKSARDEFRRQRKACILIQRAYRRHSCMLKFKRVKNAVVVVQRRYRAQKAMLEQKKCYLTMVRSAVLIQATYRMRSSRNTFLAKKSAALCIQKAFRVYLNERRRENELKAVVVIQRYWRGYSLMRKCRTEYSTKRQAAVVLQSAFRGISNRKQFVKAQKAVVVLQSWFKMVVAKRSYNRKRDAAILIQQHFRAYILGTITAANYHLMRGALITLQAVVRGYSARREYQRRRKLVIKLQASARMMICRRRYEEMRGAALLMQRRVRAVAIGKVMREDYIRKKQACVFIQGCYRRFIEVKKAAVTIQSCWRMHKAREEYNRKRQACVSIQRCYRRFVVVKKAAVIIQSCWRMHKAREEYNRKRQACIKIQAAVRGFLAEQKYLLYQGAALVIQQYYRAYVGGSLERLRFQRAKHACIRIQACVRMFLCRRRYMELRHNAVKIQQRYRAQIAMKTQRKRYVETKAAVLRIQSVYRGYKARVYTATLKKQKMVEAYIKLVKEQQLLIKRNSAAVVIQKNYRGSKERQEYRAVRAAAMQIQKFYRLHKQAAAVREQFVAQRRSAVVIQSVYRIYKAKKVLQNLKHERDVKNRSALIIQRQYKRFISQREFLKTKQAVGKIQDVYRGYLLARKLRNEFQSMRVSAVKLQCAYRVYKSKQALKRLKEAKYREFNAAVTIQKSSKRFVTRKRFLEMKQATVNLQMLWRRAQLARRTRADFIKKRSSVLVIQSACRCYLARRFLEKLRYEETVREASVVRIQRCFRAYIARRNHKLEERERFNRIRKACILIQSVWRGYLVRSRIANRKIIKARKRIESANSEATEAKKLCNRTASALSYLLNCKYLTTVYDALKNLEVATRLSYTCCERLIADNALSVIFEIITKCNRGLPSIGIIEVAISIVLNLTKCPSTYKDVYEEPDCIEILVDLMTKFREKKTAIFVIAATSLYLLCKDTTIAKELKSNEKFTKKIKSLHYMTGRKVDLETKRHKVTNKAKETKDCNYIFEQFHSTKRLIETLGSH